MNDDQKLIDVIIDEIKTLRAECDDYKKTAWEYYRENVALRAENARLKEREKILSKDNIYRSEKIIEFEAENARLREENAALPKLPKTVEKTMRLEMEIARLREALKPLAEAVRAAKEAASYNRHKREHCISQSMWSALCDQEKQARAAMGETE